MTRKTTNELLRFGSPAAMIALKVPATAFTHSAAYLGLVAKVPDSAFPFVVGLAIATWILDPWTKDSRLASAWHRLTDKFTVEHFVAGSFVDFRGQHTPDTDIAVRLRIRFTRNVRGAQLWLRVFSCTGLGRPPFQHVISLGKMDAIKGQILDIPVVDIGIPTPGWDHERKRGWGPDAEQNLIVGCGNVVSLECQGRWLTQRHKVYIALVSHVGHDAPRIYIQDELDQIFDTSRDARVGQVRRDHHERP